MLDENDKKIVKDITIKVLKTSYKDKRLGNTPNDSLQLAPKKYINMYGSIQGRPSSVVASVGQQYFSTDLQKPIFYDGKLWRDATGSVVASN